MNTTTTPSVASGPNSGATTVRTTPSAEGAAASRAGPSTAGAAPAASPAGTPVSNDWMAPPMRPIASVPTVSDLTLSWMVAW